MTDYGKSLRAAVLSVKMPVYIEKVAIFGLQSLSNRRSHGHWTKKSGIDGLDVTKAKWQRWSIIRRWEKGHNLPIFSAKFENGLVGDIETKYAGQGGQASQDIALSASV